MASPITPDNPEGHVIAYFNATTLLTDFTAALIAAFQDGVAVSRVLGQVTYRTAHLTSTVDTVANRTELLEHQLTDVRRRERRATSFALSAEDDETADKYEQAARDARSEVRRLTSELAALQAAPAQPPQEPFTAFVDVLLTALRRLAESRNAVTQAEFNALETVLPSFRLERDVDGRWWGSATLRLSTDDGLAELGPIRWPVRDRNSGSTAVRAQMPRTRQDGTSRNELRVRLRAESDVPVNAARILMNSPFPQLPHVVLHGVGGHDLPDWVGPQWREPQFVEWVTRRYTNTSYAWPAKSSYASVSYLGQYVMHVVAELGVATAQQVADTLEGLRAPNIVKFTRGASDAPSAWLPCVLVGSADGTSSQVDPKDRTLRRTAAQWARNLPMTPVICSCGSAATVMARVPEVPRNVLCGCGRMPDAEQFEMTPSLRFPEEYASLQLSKRVCAAQLTQAMSDTRWVPRGRTAQVLAQADLLTAGATTTDLAQTLHLESRQLHDALVVLEGRGLVRRSQDRPAVWTSTSRVPR